MYERKNEWAANRMEQNKNIDTLTEQQHDALAWLCSIRHTIHTNQKSMFISNSVDFDLWKYIDGVDDNTIKEKLESVGLPNNLSWDALFVPSDYDYNMRFNEDKSWYNDYDAAYEIHIDFLEKVNTDIENYLRNIDKEHGTNYAPSGHTRLLVL